MTPEKERIFQKIYLENERYLHQFVARHTITNEDAEDIIHEVFLVLMFRLEEFIPEYFNDPKKVRAFLFGIAKNNLRHY